MRGITRLLSRLSKLFLFLFIFHFSLVCAENSENLKLGTEKLNELVENATPDIKRDLNNCEQIKETYRLNPFYSKDQAIDASLLLLFKAQRIYDEPSMIKLTQCLEEIIFMQAKDREIRSWQLTFMGPMIESSGVKYFNKNDKEILDFLKSFLPEENINDWFGWSKLSEDKEFIFKWNVNIFLTRYHQNREQYVEAKQYIDELKKIYPEWAKVENGENFVPGFSYIVKSFEFQNAYGLNDLKAAKKLSDKLDSELPIFLEIVKQNPGYEEYLSVVYRNLEYKVFIGEGEKIKEIINQCLSLLNRDTNNRNTKITKLYFLKLLGQIDPSTNQTIAQSLEENINQLTYETLLKKMTPLLVKKDFSMIDNHIRDADFLCKSQIRFPKLVLSSDCPMRDAIFRLKEDMTEEILALEKDISLKNYYQNDINRIRKNLNEDISSGMNIQETTTRANNNIRTQLNNYKFDRFWEEYAKYMRQIYYQIYSAKRRHDQQIVDLEILIDRYNKPPAFSWLNNKTSGSDSQNFVAEKLNNNDPDMIRIVEEIKRETYMKDLSHLFMAAYFAKKYINLFQDIRVDLIQFSKEDELSFTEAYKNTLKKYVPLFYQVNDINAAMSTFNVIKENEYYEFIRRASVSKDFFSRIAFTDREQEFENNLKPYQDAVQKLNTEYNNLLQSDPTSEKIKIIQEQIIQKLDDIETIHYAYLNQDFLSEIDPTRGGAVALTNESKNIDDAQYFDANSTRTKMYISVNQNEIQTYVVGKDFKERFSSQINKIDLIKLVNEIAIQVQQKKVVEPLTIKKISNLIVQKPFKFLKEKNINDLQIYLTDNFLIPIPFGLLEFNNQKVLDQFNIEYLNLKKNTKGNFAKNNHFDLFGATEGNEDFDDLPGVKDEINLLVKASANKTSSQDVFLGKDFNKRTLIQSFNDNTNYIHLASHLKITGNADDLIYLYLGDKSTINLRDLRENMPIFDNELVTLSACETANLFDIDHDQSFDGLAGIFQEKGAKNVLATLWKVSDEATSNFMYVFYTLLSHNNLDYAEALTLTQRLFFYNSLDKLPSDIKLAELNNKKFLNKIKKFNHPYFWSPFIIYSSN